MARLVLQEFRDLGRWHELCTATADLSPFQTPEWHLALGGFSHLLVVLDGDDWLSALPVRRSALGGWTSSGTSVSDYLDPLVRVGSESEVRAAYAESGLAVALAHVRPSSALSSLMWGNRTDQDVCLACSLPSTWGAFRQRLGKSLRADLDRWDSGRSRSLGATIVESPNEDGLASLVHLHEQRWRGRGLPGSFWGKRGEFHRRWVASAPEGTVWISVLVVEGSPVGAIYAMRAGKTCYFYQSGVAAAPFSPGSVLIAHTIRRAIGEGCTRFDMLRGNEAYKRRWMPDQEFRLQFLAQGDWRGRILSGAARARQKIKEQFEK
ncbi:MAG: GNAT family N-acetyltransferase [Fimbriimonas sp.]